MTFQSYQVGQETAHETIHHVNPIRVVDSTLRTTMVDGVVTEERVSQDRGSVAELNPHHGTAHFASTAVHPRGLPVTEILPTTLVTIDGVQAPVAFWEREGRIRKGPDGTYQEAAQAVEAPADNSGDLLPIPEQEMARINDALEPIPQEHLDGIAATAMGVAVGRLDESSLVLKFQRSSGCDEVEARARLDTLKAAYKAQADAALMYRNGIGSGDLGAFYAWAKTKRQGALQEAVQKQMHAHDVSGYKTLAAEWLSTVPPSVEALKAGGVPVRKNGNSVECYVRGQWMSPGAAARAGLI